MNRRRRRRRAVIVAVLVVVAAAVWLVGGQAYRPAREVAATICATVSTGDLNGPVWRVFPTPGWACPMEDGPAFFLGWFPEYPDSPSPDSS